MRAALLAALAAVASAAPIAVQYNVLYSNTLTDGEERYHMVPASQLPAGITTLFVVLTPFVADVDLTTGNLDATDPSPCDPSSCDPFTTSGSNGGSSSAGGTTVDYVELDRDPTVPWEDLYIKTRAFSTASGYSILVSPTDPTTISPSPIAPSILPTPPPVLPALVTVTGSFPSSGQDAFYRVLPGTIPDSEDSMTVTLTPATEDVDLRVGYLYGTDYCAPMDCPDFNSQVSSSAGSTSIDQVTLTKTTGTAWPVVIVDLRSFGNTGYTVYLNPGGAGAATAAPGGGSSLPQPSFLPEPTFPVFAVEVPGTSAFDFQFYRVPLALLVGQTAVEVLLEPTGDVDVDLAVGYLDVPGTGMCYFTECDDFNSVGSSSAGGTSPDSVVVSGPFSADLHVRVRNYGGSLTTFNLTVGPAPGASPAPGVSFVPTVPVPNVAYNFQMYYNITSGASLYYRLAGSLIPSTQQYVAVSIQGASGDVDLTVGYLSSSGTCFYTSCSAFVGSSSSNGGGNIVDTVIMSRPTGGWNDLYIRVVGYTENSYFWLATTPSAVGPSGGGGGGGGGGGSSLVVYPLSLNQNVVVTVPLSGSSSMGVPQYYSYTPSSSGVYYTVSAVGTAGTDCDISITPIFANLPSSAEGPGWISDLTSTVADSISIFSTSSTSSACANGNVYSAFSSSTYCRTQPFYIRVVRGVPYGAGPSICQLQVTQSFSPFNPIPGNIINVAAGLAAGALAAAIIIPLIVLGVAIGVGIYCCRRNASGPMKSSGGGTTTVTVINPVPGTTMAPYPAQPGAPGQQYAVPGAAMV